MGPIDPAQSRHLAAGHGRRLRVITDVVTVKATPAETGDAYALYEVETPPSGGTPPHIQRYDDETCYVLDGRYTFLVGDEQIDLLPGDYVFVPRGTPHAFVNAGPTTARMLVLVTPGNIQGAFFDEVGTPASRPAWEPDMERVLAIAPKYGIAFQAPAPGEEVVPAEW